MRRLFAVALIVGAVWIANLLLPPGNQDAQLRSPAAVAVRSNHSSLASPARAIVISAAQAEATSALEGGDVTDARLIGRLQAQLRRVGCYHGRIDGKWSDLTQRALARFNDHAGLLATADLPSPAMLPVVSAFSSRACGTPCPPGTQPNADGYCTTASLAGSASPAKETIALAEDSPQRLAMAAAHDSTNIRALPAKDDAAVPHRRASDNETIVTPSRTAIPTASAQVATLRNPGNADITAGAFAMSPAPATAVLTNPAHAVLPRPESTLTVAALLPSSEVPTSALPPDLNPAASATVADTVRHVPLKKTVAAKRKPRHRPPAGADYQVAAVITSVAAKPRTSVISVSSGYGFAGATGNALTIVMSKR